MTRLVIGCLLVLAMAQSCAYSNIMHAKVSSHVYEKSCKMLSQDAEDYLVDQGYVFALAGWSDRLSLQTDWKYEENDDSAERMHIKLLEAEQGGCTIQIDAQSMSRENGSVSAAVRCALCEQTFLAEYDTVAWNRYRSETKQQVEAEREERRAAKASSVDDKVTDQSAQTPTPALAGVLELCPVPLRCPVEGAQQ